MAGDGVDAKVDISLGEPFYGGICEDKTSEQSPIWWSTVALTSRIGFSHPLLQLVGGGKIAIMILISGPTFPYRSRLFRSESGYHTFEQSTSV